MRETIGALVVWKVLEYSLLHSELVDISVRVIPTTKKLLDGGYLVQICVQDGRWHYKVRIYRHVSVS